MRVTETIPTTPIAVEKSIRGDEVRVLTSGKAGKIIPVSYIPILREDRVSRGNIRLRLNMAETIHPLMNAVNVTAYAHYVPYLAMEMGDPEAGTLRRQFDGMDQFNRVYKGQEEPGGGAIPFFPHIHTGRTYSSDHIFHALGIHVRQDDAYNPCVLQAYNAIINHRRRARSKHLTLRNPLAGAIAQAFWKNPNLYHIVPDFDQAMMDGEVPLSFADILPGVRSVPVDGIMMRSDTHIAYENLQVIGGGSLPPDRQSQGWTPDPNSPQDDGRGLALAASEGSFGRRSDVRVDVSSIFAEMQAGGMTLSLSNIELARQTAAFAKLREQFSGIEDEHLIDLLMQGIRVPDEANKQPILLARSSTIFGYSERHAMDGDNLEKSVTTGVAELSLNFRTPPLNTGGVIMITVEIVPEQLFERMEDPYLRITDSADFPDFLRDYLDPEKVEVVQNRYVDTEHATPNGTFGYAPLNHGWKRSITRIGGKYRRPETAGFVEDRQRFWSIEQVNPALTTDFYLVPENLPHTVFADSTADPFEILALGNVEIVGNTVFGRILEEDGGHYEAVAAKVDHTRISQE